MGLENMYLGSTLHIGRSGVRIRYSVHTLLFCRVEDKSSLFEVAEIIPHRIQVTM
jgi:hypothetical protein